MNDAGYVALTHHTFELVAPGDFFSMTPRTAHETRELVCLGPDGSTLDQRTYVDAVTHDDWGLVESAVLDVEQDGRTIVAVRSERPIDFGSGPVEGSLVVATLRLATPEGTP